MKAAQSAIASTSTTSSRRMVRMVRYCEADTTGARPWRVSACHFTKRTVG